MVFENSKRYFVPIQNATYSFEEFDKEKDAFNYAIDKGINVGLIRIEFISKAGGSLCEVLDWEATVNNTIEDWRN